jgi:MFS family permease
VVLALAVASIVSVSDNGLGFTATAELAGRAWSGRALGVQNTMQNVAAFATAPLVGLLAGSYGFGWAFAAVAVFPALGAWLTPVKGERQARSAAGRTPEDPPGDGQTREGRTTKDQSAKDQSAKDQTTKDQTTGA